MLNHFQSIFLTVYLSVLSFGAAQNSMLSRVTDERIENNGPYEVILETVKDCQDKGTGEVYVRSTATTKEDGKTYHSGELALPSGLKDNMKAVGDASIWKKNQWQPIGLVSKLNFNKACTGIKNMAGLWFDILKAANVDPLDCPIPGGTYNFVDYHVNKVDSLKTLRYGKYRVRLHIYKKSQKIGCLSYLANVVKA